MNKNEKGSFGKLLVLALIVIGVYFSMGVEPVERKRVNATFDNFKNLNAVSFDFDFNIEEAREGFYDLQVDGYMEPKKRVGTGDFIVDTRIEGALQTIEGRFAYEEPYLYINFSEDGLPITLEEFFRENYDLNIETARSNWLQIELDSPVFDFGEEVEVISDDEEIGEEEMYRYGIDLVSNYFSNDLSAEIFTGKKNLQIHRLTTEDEASFEDGWIFPEPLTSFSDNSSPKVSFQINFHNFETEKEITVPDEFIEL